VAAESPPIHSSNIVASCTQLRTGVLRKRNSAGLRLNTSARVSPEASATRSEPFQLARRARGRTIAADECTEGP